MIIRSPKLLIAVLLLLAVSTTATPCAIALDKAKAAAATAQQAASALERGDHKQAAHLYLEAYKLDPATSDYLYGAARESQAVGDADRAEDLYKQYLGLGGTDPKRTDNARRFIGELRADAKGREAEVTRSRGDGALAAQLYREAWTLDGTRVAYLVRGARAAQDARNTALAVELLQLFLRHAPAGDPDRAEVKARLDSLQRETPAVTGAQAAPARAPEAPRGDAAIAKPADTLTATAPTSRPSRVPAWIALGSGGALVVAGAGIWASTLGDRSALETALTQRQNGLISGVTLADAQSRNQSIITRNVAAGIAGGVGVAAVGLGLWLWFSGSEMSVAPVMSGNGVALVGQW